ncbi:MAG: hypothetical protein SFV53_06210 [Rickettsiales bacterium]|nr:hypothetical protein [Rickettsiales bacterium]
MKSDSKSSEAKLQNSEELIPVGRFSESDLMIMSENANQVKHFIGTIEIPEIARGTACLMEDGKILTCLHNILDYSVLDSGRAELINFEANDVSVYFVKDDTIHKYKVRNAPITGLDKLKAEGAKAWCFDYALLETDGNPVVDLGGGFKPDQTNHFGSAFNAEPSRTLAISGPFATLTEEGELKFHRFSSISANQAAESSFYQITQAGDHPSASGFSGMGIVGIGNGYKEDTLYAIHSYRDNQDQQTGAKISEIRSSMRDKIRAADDSRLDPYVIHTLQNWYEVLTTAKINLDHSITRGRVIDFDEAVEILRKGGNIAGDSRKEVTGPANKAWGKTIADPAHTPLGWPHLHHHQRASSGHALYPGEVQRKEMAEKERQAKLAEQQRLKQIAESQAERIKKKRESQDSDKEKGGR